MPALPLERARPPQFPRGILSSQRSFPAAVASFVGSKTTFRTGAGGGSGCHMSSASDTLAISAYLILLTTLQPLRLFLKHRHLHHVNLTLVRVHMSAQFDVVPHVVL